MKNSKTRLPRVINTKSYKKWKINQMKAGKTKLPDRIQGSGLVSECSPGKIQGAQLVHPVEANNFQLSHVGFFSS